MNSVSIEFDGYFLDAEVLNVVPLDASRSAITVRSQEKLERGRSCFLRTSTGESLECVVSNYNTMGNVYVVELRCAQGISSL